MGSAVPRKKRAIQKAIAKMTANSACNPPFGGCGQACVVDAEERLEAAFLWEMHAEDFTDDGTTFYMNLAPPGEQPSYTHGQMVNVMSASDVAKQTNLLSEGGFPTPFKTLMLQDAYQIMVNAGSASTSPTYYLHSGSAIAKTNTGITQMTASVAGGRIYGTIYHQCGPQAAYMQCVHRTGSAGTASFMIPSAITGAGNSHSYSDRTSSIRVAWAGALSKEETLNIYCSGGLYPGANPTSHDGYAKLTGTLAGDGPTFWNYKKYGDKNYVVGSTIISTGALPIQVVLTSSNQASLGGGNTDWAHCGFTVTYCMTNKVPTYAGHHP